MVFYTNFLPTELWFIIYRREHEMYQINLNREIKSIFNEMVEENLKLINSWIMGDLILGLQPLVKNIPKNILWNLNEYIAFKKNLISSCL